jgi:hypothetical protein
MDHASFAESQHAQLRKRENMEMGVLTPAEASLPQPCLGLRADRGEREVRTEAWRRARSSFWVE